MKKEAMLYEKTADRQVECHLCSHLCRLQETKFGICGVRQNLDGCLFTHVYGEVIASNVDPIEKKPLYHFLPGSRSYSIATLGCNFKCGFCQNWQISQQSIRERRDVPGRRMDPREIVTEALGAHCRSIAYTYTEPTVFFEYAYETARIASHEGLRNVLVTNGFMTTEAVDAIHPFLDAANIDLKSFRDEFYRTNCKGRLQPVLDTIQHMKEQGIWIEVTTLVIPGENDSEQELASIADFIAQIGVEVPWHISRFHPDYQFTQRHRATPPATLSRAAQIAGEKGLQHVYLGNVAADSDTYCPNCRALLVARSGYSIREDAMRAGECQTCGTAVAGVWA